MVVEWRVQEPGLYPRIGPGSRSSVLSRWRRFNVVLAMHPQPLDDLKGVLAHAGLRGSTRLRGTQMCRGSIRQSVLVIEQVTVLDCGRAASFQQTGTAFAYRP